MRWALQEIAVTEGAFDADVAATTRRLTRAYCGLIACCALVTAISVHDAMLVIVNHELIVEEERNPLGQWLLALQGGDVWLFVLVKLFGTSVVCAILLTLFRSRPTLALFAGGFLSCLQLTLLIYLTFW
jgi:hypothetical protein